MPSPAYYAVDPARRATNPASGALGTILSGVGIWTTAWLLEQGSATIMAQPLLSEHNHWILRAAKRLGFPTGPSRLFTPLAGHRSFMPISFWGTIHKELRGPFTQYMSRMLGPVSPRTFLKHAWAARGWRKIVAPVYGFAGSVREMYTHATKMYAAGGLGWEAWLTPSAKARRAAKWFVGSWMAFRAAQIWQGFDVGYLMASLAVMVGSGISALGRMREEYLQAKALAQITQADVLTGITQPTFTGEERYFFQESLRSHILTRQLLESGVTENPYSVYRLIG